MAGNFRKRLHDHLRAIHPTYVASQLRATTRSQIHRAINEARKELEKFGYHIAIVTDTGEMISARSMARR